MKKLVLQKNNFLGDKKTNDSPARESFVFLSPNKIFFQNVSFFLEELIVGGDKDTKKAVLMALCIVSLTKHGRGMFFRLFIAKHKSRNEIT